MSTELRDTERVESIIQSVTDILRKHSEGNIKQDGEIISSMNYCVGEAGRIASILSKAYENMPELEQMVTRRRISQMLGLDENCFPCEEQNETVNQ